MTLISAVRALCWEFCHCFYRSVRQSLFLPSLTPLNHICKNDLGPSSNGRLPAFIASIGTEVHTGLHFVDSTAADGDVVHLDEATSGGENLTQEHEAEVGLIDIPAV